MKRLLSWSASLLLCTGFLSADSLWTETSISPLADRRALAVGDLLSVIVQENNSATKNQTKKTQKESSIDASINQFLFKPESMKFMTKGGMFPGMNASSKTDFNGGGQVQNSDSINSRFSVRVVDALPNGNLLIEGRRSTSFSGEGQTIVMRVTVRRVDVTAENTILSHQLADLTLRFDGSGSVNDSQKRGWFGKVWDKVNPM
jgi:flagellar L-ring protein precursor FlgH